MSIKLMSLVWDNGPNDATQRFVLLALADRANDQGGSCYPSILELSKKCAMSQRTVIRAIDALVGGGFLVRKRHKSRSNSYTIIVDRLRPSESVSDKLSPLVSDKLSHRQVTDCHSVSDRLSPQQVTDCHMTSDTVSPDPSVIHQEIHQGSTKEGEGPRPPAGPPPFVPVPEEVRRRQRVDALLAPSTPDMIEQAPAAMRLLAAITGNWPGLNAQARLVERLGDQPDEAALRQAWAMWSASGNRPTNYEGLCDWYDQLVQDPSWTPAARFKSNGYRNLKADPDAREEHNRSVLADVAREMKTGGFTPW